MSQSKEHYHYFHIGNSVRLRGIEKEDYTKGMLKWANDPEFNKYLSYGLKPSSYDSMEMLYDNLMNKENYIFAICSNESQQLIGIIGMHQPNWQVRSIEYAIHIGEKDFWNKGVSSEATDYILKYAFETLNINKVWLGVNEANQKAVKFYLKKGFVQEGILRAEIFRKNRYFNSVRMSILREEYEK